VTDESRGPPHGPIWQLLADEHARLDSLLERAGACQSAEELSAYDQFRRALLRHIGMEEKVLLPAAERARGTPIEEAGRLRLDHGALAALMIPSPQPRIIRAIRTVLARHNPLEESANGVYDCCELLAGAAADEVLASLKATGPVPVKPHLDTTKVYDALRRALARASYDEHLADT
jgi:hypothetical protein